MKKLITPLVCAAGLAAVVLRAGDEKASITPNSGGAATGIELPARSSRFVEIAAIGPQTNQVWGRPIPGRVSLQTAARVSVGALVDGRVEEVMVRPGDRVAAGTPLLRIQSTVGGQTRAEAEQAKARLEGAEETLRRYTTMVARGVGTELERFEAEIRAREARIDAERTGKAGSLIGSGVGSQVFLLAPTNGTVLTVGAATGSVLKAGDDGIVEMGDPSRVWLEADVAEDDAARITCGQRALVESLRGGHSGEAKVEVLTSHVDPVTRRRRVYLAPASEALPWLTLGLLVELRLTEPEDQLVLPAEAVLIKDGERRIVYVQSSDGRLHSRDVLVNPAPGGRVRVLKGLTVGERVVVKGALLVDGRSEQLL